MLHTLRLKNWRSFRDETITLAEPGAVSGGLKIFIGANASGKSNVIDALRLLHEALPKDLEAATTQRGGINSVRFQGASTNENVLIEVAFLDNRVPQTPIEMTYTVEIAEKDNVVGAAKEVLVERVADAPDKGFDFTWGSGELYGYTDNYYGHTTDDAAISFLSLKGIGQATQFTQYSAQFANVRNLIQFIERWQFLTVDLNAIRAARYSERATHLDPDAGNLANVLHTLASTSPQLLANIQENLKLILGHVESISTRVERGIILLSVKEPYFEHSFDARATSDGTLYLLAILTALELLPENGLLAIDEPEFGVHPLEFGLLVDTFREYTEASQRQVLVTTHSTELVDASNRPEEVMTVERAETGESHIRTLDVEDTREALEDFRLGELWYMRLIGGVP